jgi:hypothetical protein
MNLVVNAKEAMEAQGGGTISIGAEAEGGTLKIRVADTGPGVPTRIAPRLVQYFVTSGKSEGTGLGLAIVKRIVEEHGGTVRLCPSIKGACFVLSFPGAIKSAVSGGRLPPDALVSTRATTASKNISSKKRPARAGASALTPSRKKSGTKAAKKKAASRPKVKVTDRKSKTPLVKPSQARAKR